MSADGEKVIQWIVCVQLPAVPAGDGSPGTPARLEYWGAYDNSADAQAHVPFTEDVATQVAAGINAGHANTGASAMAYPLAETLQPGV